MKREIKFRAWDKFNGSFWHMNGKSDLAEFFSRCLHFSEGGNELIFQQYTGLKDKNGKDIYEGDIVKCWDDAAMDESWGLDKVHTGIIEGAPDYSHTGIIEYTPDCYSLKIPGKQTYNTPSVKSWNNDVYLDKWSNAENIEVIGNIYEHSSLLNSGEKVQESDTRDDEQRI